jgi:predicted nucleic acid-binding protein
VIVYLDTSAYVKLIIDEDGAGQTRALFQQARRAATSVVTYAEASAALSRRDREAGSPAKRLRSWTEALDQSWSNTLAVPVLAKAAGSLAIAHGLRGMDAVQLTAAMTLRERMSSGADEGRVLFAAFDRQLLEAAEREGFATLGRPLE